MDSKPTKARPRTREERIEVLRQKKAQLEARLSELQNAKTKEERKLDAKRKIIIGACIQDRIQRGLVSEAELAEWLNPFVTRQYERELLGLPPQS